MILKCYLIDDEVHALDVLEGYISRTPGLLLCGKNTNPLDALADISGGNIPHITFLDIDMPQLTGLDLAGIISHQTNIIFTTSFREHGPEAYEKDAVDYLLKPITYERFLKAISKIRKMLSSADPERVLPSYFLVKSGTKGNFRRINIPDIRYIENIGNYIYIHTGNEKIPAYLTLSDILEKLPEEEFSRIHQSFVVNHQSLLAVEYNQVKVAEGLFLPVGGTYRSGFRKKMQDKILISKREKAE